MENKVRIFSPIKIDDSYDVVVAGGGLAGVMAAISAAREGCKVIIIEKHGCFGGMATSGLVFPFMRDTEYGSETPVNAGLYSTLKEEIYSLGGSVAPHSRKYKEEFMKVALDRRKRGKYKIHVKTYLDLSIRLAV